MKFYFNCLLQRLQQYIWETRASQLPAYLRPMLGSLRIGHLIVRDLMEGQLTLRSMGLVYTTLLALVPLLALSFSVLKGFGVHNQLEPIMLNLFSALGEKGVEVTQRIIGFVDNIKAGVLGSVGLALLIYTVISLLQKIERAFNFTWRVSEQRPLAQRFSDYLSVILIGPVLVFSAIGITASISSSAFVKSMIEVEAVGFLVAFVSRLLPYLLIILAFTLIYIFVPNTKVKFKSALIGGMVAGILWESTGWAFAAFVVNSSKYTAIYSAFATLIVFMIWLYLSWLILLVGGSIAFYHQHPEHRTLQRNGPGLSNRMRERLALMIMTLIAQHYYQHKQAWSIDTLSKKLNIGIEMTFSLISDLIKADLIVPTSAMPTTYLPAHALETMKLNDIMIAIRQSGEKKVFSSEDLPEVATIEQIFNDMESAMQSVLSGRSLRDLVQETQQQETPL